MKTTCDISIVTVNYNGYEETYEMIKSIQEHIHTCSYELIVVDNGSRQNEADLLKKSFPFIQALRSEKNLGFAGGNNLGIHIAQGKYIFLLNNDTFVREDRFSHLVQMLESNPNIGAVSPKIKFAFSPQNIQYAGFTPLSKYTLRNKGIGFNEPDTGQYNTPASTSFLHGAALIFKREILQEIGEMPEIYFLYYEEMDWCTQITRKGYQLWYVPECTIYHKESSATGQDSPLKTYYLTRNRLLYTWRNRKGYSRIIALFYQFIFANPKNIIVNLLKGKIQQIKAILKGCIDFFILKNKMA